MMIKYNTAASLMILAVVARAFSPMAFPRRTSSSFIRRSPSSRPAIMSSYGFTRGTAAAGIFHAHLFNKEKKRNKHHEISERKTQLSLSSENETPSIIDDSNNSRPPITLLAGFLGSGKTTTLQNLLNNKEGLKIGIIVNDVASINIDSKLLSNPNTYIGSEETVELQNGCACCSLADELLATVGQLTDNGKRDLDCIVIELSGVADPEAVKRNWMQAERMGHPATKFAKFEKVVTLIDSSTFGTDWMTWDTQYERDGWVDPNSDNGEERMVPELLAEQIEAADVLVINKIDLAGIEQTKVASNLAQNMNEKATVFEVKYGNISIQDVIQTPGSSSVQEREDNEKLDDHSSSYSHDHNTSSTDEAHTHSHQHAEDDCDSHDHSHLHDHDRCLDPTCTDPTHDHSHSHDHDGCSDPTCTDPTHDHSHSHDHNTSTANLGISNFVYKRDRPFHTMRLLGVLNKWPVPVKDELDLDLLKEAAQKGVSIEGNHGKSPFVGVLRSKGFCWMAPTEWCEDGWRHDTAMYWSHAGKHFGLTNAGNWWGSIPMEQMKAIFGGDTKEYERIVREDFVTEEFGDRRQEIVFIGANLNESDITNALDECLCTDDEMELYRNEVEAMITRLG